MDNEKKELNEEHLELAAGGTSSADEKCYFTMTLKAYGKIERGYYWLPCPYSGAFCWGCACHGKEHCVDNYHRVDDDYELIPTGFANHAKKKRDQGYQTL